MGGQRERWLGKVEMQYTLVKVLTLKVANIWARYLPEYVQGKNFFSGKYIFILWKPSEKNIDILTPEIKRKTVLLIFRMKRR